MGWTALRDAIYTDMLLMSLPQAVASGQLFSATGTGGRNYVTREDCALTAAGALASSFDGRRILDVTGPASVTFAEVAATLARSARPRPRRACGSASNRSSPTSSTTARSWRAGTT